MVLKQNYCDRIRRRDMLRFGATGALGMGVNLPQILASQDAQTTPGQTPHDMSFIVVFLQGGLSTIDTWDMKPDAPAEFRGEFDPISTNIPGIQLSEHLPRLAQQMDKFSVVRSFGHRNSNHGAADHYLLTAYHPEAGFNGGLKPNNQKPSHGSVMAKMLGPRGSVPPYVCLPKMHNSASSSYLGSTVAPFVVEADPNVPDFSVPDLAPPIGLQAERLANRRELIAQVDRFQKSAETQANRKAKTLSTYQQKAFDLMTSKETKSAFNIHLESTSLREEYGRNTLGQSCLMARRLVEAGVRCVLIDHTDWDTHYNNFHVLKNQLLPKLDGAMSGLLRDLDDRGILEKTLVLVTGEFGRTPRINQFAGRDHWGPSSAIAMAGGGIRGGTIVGASDERAEKPATTPYRPEDLAATIYNTMGINPKTEFYTQEGRPIPIVPGHGRVIHELFA